MPSALPIPPGPIPHGLHTESQAREDACRPPHSRPIWPLCASLAVRDEAGGFPRAAVIGTKLMIIARWFACALAAALLAATAGQAAELPAQNNKPAKAE